MSTWVNFKELRAKLDFEQVLRCYGVEIKRKGDQHHGFCPLPNHNGKKNSPSFSANLKRGIFQCFGCGAKGNVLEFAVLMENAAVEDSAALRKVALVLQQRFCPELSAISDQHPPKSPEKSESTASKREVPVVINAPLDFELKDLDRTHPYLRKRGFSDATIEHFGLGYCSRGMLKDRVVIPLHDQKGRLIGYAGRLVDDAAINEGNPRYRFPGSREREGKTFEFRKSRFLYNGFRIKEPVNDLIVVESFTSVWWLHQNGRPNVVATMGADCSERQVELLTPLVKPEGHVRLLTDGDEAGERWTESLLLQVGLHRFVRWVKLEKDHQPTDLTAEQLKSLLTF